MTLWHNSHNCSLLTFIILSPHFISKLTLRMVQAMSELALRGLQNKGRNQQESAPSSSRETDFRLAQLERSLDRFDGKLDRIGSQPTIVYTGTSSSDTAKYALVSLACVAGAGYAYVWYK